MSGSIQPLPKTLGSWDDESDPLVKLLRRCRRGFSGGEWEGWARYIRWVGPEVRKHPLRALVLRHLERQLADGVVPSPAHFLTRLSPAEMALLGDSFRVQLQDPPPAAPAPSGASWAGHSRSAEYRTIRSLGKGQFGEVLQVESHATHIQKALKVMHRPADDEGGKRELRSLDLVKNEQHPYLLRTEDYWIEDNKLYVLMELADGTLRDWQKGVGHGLPLKNLFRVMREVAEVVDDIHTKRVLHRDIKPENILLKCGHAKVGDFGLARCQDRAILSQSMLVGSPGYMAPEVWRGRGGAASDLYSLAVTYAELRQNRHPVAADAIGDVILAHLGGHLELRSDVFSAAERTVLRKALAREADQRYASCTDFVHALADALRGKSRRTGVTPAATSTPYCPNPATVGQLQQTLRSYLVSRDRRPPR